MGMERKAAVAVALVLFAPLAHAGCKELSAAIETSQKAIAEELAKGRTEDNGRRPQEIAPLELARQVRVNNQLQAMQANLLLMDRAKCALPSDPIDATGAAYENAAAQCFLSLGARPDGACDRAAWKRWK